MLNFPQNSAEHCRIEGMSNLYSAVIWNRVFAVLAVVAYAMSQNNPDRIAFLFAAVMFVINGTTALIIAHIKEAAK